MKNAKSQTNLRFYSIESEVPFLCIEANNSYFKDERVNISPKIYQNSTQVVPLVFD